MYEDLNVHNNIHRLPPENIEAEELVLGGIILDPGAMERALMAVSPQLEPKDFYIEAHQVIYQTMLDLHSIGRPTDLLCITDMLGTKDRLTEIGGRNKLATLLDRTVSTSGIDYLVQLLREKRRYRDYIRIGSEIQELAYSPSFTDLSRLQEVAFEKIESIADDSFSEETSHVCKAVINNFQEISDRHQGIALPGIPCGFYDLDAMTNGFQRGDLIIIAGRPSMGKTAFVVSCAKNIADISKLPVIIFSLEMSKEQLSLRILSERSRIESGCLTTGRVSETQWTQLGEAVNWLSDIPIYINDNPSATPAYIAAEIKKAKAEYHIDELGGIVIDYLQLMDGNGYNRVQDLSRITRALKEIARIFKVPVFCLSQLSRAVEARTNKRPMMSDLRDSGSIEQDADLVIMLYRDDYYNPDTTDRGVAEVIISKHRNGPTGTVKLLFEPQFTAFKNLRV